MAEPQTQGPPSIRRDADGVVDVNSLADIVEWFLANDERTSRIRHPNTDELFKWKQADDEENGVGTYPFENAEARFAIGTLQALEHNNTEPLLKDWITDVLEALGRARETKLELSHAYDLDADAEAFSLAKAGKLTSNIEKRLYLSSCWLEALCTAEARVLGWIYKELYGKDFEPATGTSGTETSDPTESPA
ncbi:MAG: hypothetical protein JO053_14235 [Acidobacteria bacterium]|nr:hypothetical protein [Acidobacteriota bacterium]